MSPPARLPDFLEAVIRKTVEASGLEYPERAEVEDDLRAHFEDGLQAGLDGEILLARFGDPEHVGREVAAACLRKTRKKGQSGGRKEMTWGVFWQNIRFAFRQIKRQPGIHAVIIATLALCMGANTAVFSAVQGVLLTPLPYPEPGDLARVYSRFLPESGMTRESFTLSLAEVIDFRRESSTLQGIGYFAYRGYTLTGEGEEPQRIGGVRMAFDLLPTLGVPPLLGRWFNPEDDRPNAPMTVLLGYDLWTTRFGADPEILGRVISVDTETAEVVGVMPEGFQVPGVGGQIFAPFRLNEENPGARSNHLLNAVARLKPGTTIEEADAELQTLVQGWRVAYGHPQEGHTLYLVDLHSDSVGAANQTIWMLMATVFLVLLIGAANVASLLLSRAEGRVRELGLRAALGAGRLRIMGQLFSEGLVLGAIGASIGVALAVLGIWGVQYLDPLALPRMEEISLDLPVLAFTGLVALGTSFLFGLAPALQTSKFLNAAGIGSGARDTGSGFSKRLRGALVMGEVAFCVVAVLSAGLVTRSFVELMRVETGLETENRLTFTIGLPPSAYGSQEEVTTLVKGLLLELNALQEVSLAAFTSNLPLSGSLWFEGLQIQGQVSPDDGTAGNVGLTFSVSPQYLETLGIDVVRGRDFLDQEGSGAAPVALVSEEAVSAFWQNDDPLGSRVRVDDSRPWATVVGVVEDTRPRGLQAPVQPQFFFLHEQTPEVMGWAYRSGTVVLRTSRDPMAVLPAVKRVVHGIDPNMPLAYIRTMDEVYERVTARPRLITMLLTTFGSLSLVLAMVGVYGMVAYSVARRTREIGVLMAMGAQNGSIMRKMIGEGFRPVLLGLLAGLPLAFFSTPILRDSLFQVSPTDPLTVLTLIFLLGLVALLACWIPANRALRIQPASALREE